MPETKQRNMIWRAASVLDLCLDKAVISLNALGTIIIFALMLLICSDVIGRNALGTSLPGVIELAELGIVSIVFLQIADTLRSGKLMRSDALIRKLNVSFPRFALGLNVLFDATGMVLFYFITLGAFDRFSKAWFGGFYTGNLGSFTAPTWPMELSVALGSGLMCLLFLGKALKGSTGLVTGTPPAMAQTQNFDDEYKS